ncbi:hypothetical protein N7454_006200 [Penicillium verhagenii]|nr:hypothetical protein N7454_006200 [Penicillium verhagenii]
MTATTTLALTTTFSPPTSMFHRHMVYRGYYLSQGPTDWSSCFPSGYEAATTFFYSPGLCPSGYEIASSSVLNIGTNSETFATCCPSGFTAQDNNNLVWYSTNRCYSDETNTEYVWSFSKDGTTSSLTNSGGLNAKAVFIRWQESDFEVTTTVTASDATSTETVARKTASVSGPSATATTAVTNQSSSSQGGSSKAWIAGPVVGGVVACALIAFITTWYNRRRWRKKSLAGAISSQPPPHGVSELYQEPPIYEAPTQTKSTGPYELT